MSITSNAPQVAASITARAGRIEDEVLAVNQRYGLLLQTQVRANMSGRSGVIFTPEDGGPSGEVGPRAQTGDLRRSVTQQVEATPFVISASAASNEPQTRRLELGFLGTDSLGRDYDQPPYPAWRPALLALTEPYRLDVTAAFQKALTG